VTTPFARRVPASVALAGTLAALLGVFVAIHYHRLGLTLTHYDARGHLVVARRIADSITPGWQQIGAVWLPLPHLLNALPVQIDRFYRTGASGVAISIASFAITTGAIAWIVLTITGSAFAAVAATLVFALNPNVLYLQSTPMTEPLLLALTTAAVAMLIDGCSPKGLRYGNGRPVAADRASAVSVAQPSRAANHADAVAVAQPFRAADHVDAVAVAQPLRAATGVLFALACLTRYEAWPVTAGALTLAVVARWRGGEPLRDALGAGAAIARVPAAAALAFAVFSRVVVGDWFVAGGFFVPENKAIGDAALVIREIGWGVATLSSAPLVWVAAAGLAIAAASAAIDRRRAGAIVVVALAATAAIPFAAFYRGHPFRIRYMVPLLAVEAIGVGLAAGTIRRLRLPAAIAAIALTASTLRPLDATAPMVVEAQWDRPNVEARDRVTSCIGTLRPGEKIMASMGSLGHYMQEASRAGLQIRDFLHEGNGDIWLAAIERPRPFAAWILIEEKAEGGDMLARIARERPAFLTGYSRVCEGAGMALYRRTP
jgi:hypothetical protein